MKNKLNAILIISLFILLYQAPLFSQSDPKKLVVAMYEDVPRPNQFKSVLTDEWNKLNTGVTLEFKSYSSYTADPGDSLHVFVFDGLFYDYLIANGALRQLDDSFARDKQQFMDFAWKAVDQKGKIYGIPYLGCTYVYFYHKNDNAIANMSQEGIDKLKDVVGPNATPQIKVPTDKSFLMRLNGGSTDAAYYLMSYMNYYEKYSHTPYLPDPKVLDTNITKQLHTYTQMVGDTLSTFKDPVLSNWFSQGKGRCLVGFTETLYQFSPDLLNKIDFKILPTTNAPVSKTREFFVDIASINSHIPDSLLPYASQLLKLMTSHDVMYKSMIAENSSENPQFLIPTRKKVLSDLQLVHPLYTSISKMFEKCDAEPLVIGVLSKAWLSYTKAAIVKSIQSNHK